MNINVQIYRNNKWWDAATVDLRDETFGYLGASRTDYDTSYFFEVGEGVADNRALSVFSPLTLSSLSIERWPSFLLDLMPQGNARLRLATAMNIPVDARSSDITLLLRAAGSPVGNLRIKEARDAEVERFESLDAYGVSEDDILSKEDAFSELIERFGVAGSGSSGLQGEWPKIAMTQADDGFYYPDAMLPDERAQRHVIVKILRSTKPHDGLILEAEAIYSQIASEIGLNVFGPSVHRNGILIIPRFDREVVNGSVIRHGQESMVSAIGVSEFGHTDNHETYIDILKKFSTSPFEDIIEYVKRDIANLAMGNPDNHGRNTAITKYADGTVRLSPLFDFAPMRIAEEEIARSTRWKSMRGLGQMDVRPDWTLVCKSIFESEEEAGRLLSELGIFAEKLAGVKERARILGAPKRVIEFGMSACDEIVEGVLRAVGSTSLSKWGR